MERFNRQERRNQVERLKAKRKNYWGYPSRIGPDTEPRVQMDAKQLGKVVQYPQVCSCSGCGGQRRYIGRTFKEICDIITLKEEIDMIS